MNTFQSAKHLVREFHRALDTAADDEVIDILTRYTGNDYFWRGMHPFYEQQGAQAVCDVFWLPLRRALQPLQRREDIFMAGNNDVDGGQTQWVCSMGHLAGLFDRPWLGIPPTGKIVFLRYAEFNRVEADQIVESAFFCDVISVMQQAGHYPLPPQTGAFFIHPGPRTHDGILLQEQDPEQSIETMQLVNRMVEDLSELNRSGAKNCPPELLQKCWHDDMMWYGPAGIGGTYTIRRYQKQHQFPFRENLTDKVFNGHIARFAEGNYACFFGWANLTNTATGGFLGMTGNDIRADMRVVDVYRREGDKLAENWVFIDLLHYLSMQGLDVLQRLNNALLPESEDQVSQ